MIVHTRVMTEVKLDADAVEEVFLERLNQLCGGEHVYIAKDGSVESWEDTGHGSGLTEKVQGATPRQIAALKFRSELNRIKREQQQAGDEKLRKEMRKNRRTG